MMYRNWTITTFATYLGYLAQYTSPTGQAHHTSACFSTDEQAQSYVRSKIDHLLACETSRIHQGDLTQRKCA